MDADPLLAGLPLVGFRIAPEDFSCTVTADRVCLRDDTADSNGIRIAAGVSAVMSVTEIMIAAVIVRARRIALVRRVDEDRMLGRFYAAARIRINVVERDELFRGYVLPVRVNVAFALLLHDLISVIICGELEAGV